MKSTAMHQAAYYALGIVMMKGISLLMIPFVTRHLTTTEYGTLESLLVFADVATIIIGFGLVEALHRYVGLADEKNSESKQLISNCYSLAIIVTVICMLSLLFFANNIIALLPAKVSNLQLLLIAFPALLEGLIAIPLTLMRMQSLAKKFCLFSVIKAFIQALIIIVLLELGYGIDAILIAGAISSLLLILFLLPYQLQQLGPGWYKKWFGLLFWKKNLEIINYGTPIVAGRMGLFAITGLDRWLLADKVGIEQLAVYAIAIKFSLVLALLMQPFTLWWFPYRFKLLKQVGGDEKCAYYAMLGTNLGLLLGFAMMLTIPQFIQIILPYEYHEAASIVIVLLVVNMVKNAGDLLNLGCFIKSSLNQMWVQWLCAAIAVLGYLLFMEDYGVWAAVSVLLFVYSLRLGLLYRYSQIFYPLPYNHSSWILVVLAGCTCMGLLYLGVLIEFIASDIIVQLCLGLTLVISLLISLIIVNVFPNPISLWKQSTAPAAVV